jgi:hypothetical protein
LINPYAGSPCLSKKIYGENVAGCFIGLMQFELQPRECGLYS